MINDPRVKIVDRYWISELQTELSRANLNRKDTVTVRVEALSELLRIVLRLEEQSGRTRT
jgi:hypothetical protein